MELENTPIVETQSFPYRIAALYSRIKRADPGLVAMHERARLLGGQCRIESSPGGPTVVSVSLERWEPLLEAAS